MVINTFAFCRIEEATPMISIGGKSDNFRIIAIDKITRNSLSFTKSAVLWAQENDAPFFLLCSTQTSLNQNFNYERLLAMIEFASQKDADVLICSATRIDSPILTESPSLYWVNQVLGVSCMIVYSRAYSHILSLPPSWDDAHLEFTSVLTHGLLRKMFTSHSMFDGGEDIPFLVKRWGESLCIKSFLQRKTMYQHFTSCDYGCLDYEKMSIPVYVINLEERTDRLQHIKAEFCNKPEFEVNIVRACQASCGALGLWQSIRKVIVAAQKKQEDIIIICEDDHHFTPDYSKEYLFQQIITGYSMGLDYINGGSADIQNAFMVDKHLFWVDMIRCTQFIILFRDFFDKILSAEYNDSVLADVLLSRLTNNKMLIYPFVSIQEDFGYSDVTEVFNKNDGRIGKMFAETERRLACIRELTLESDSYFGDSLK